jgi:hypothetical protein
MALQSEDFVHLGSQILPTIKSRIEAEALIAVIVHVNTTLACTRVIHALTEHELQVNKMIKSLPLTSINVAILPTLVSSRHQSRSHSHALVLQLEGFLLDLRKQNETLRYCAIQNESLAKELAEMDCMALSNQRGNLARQEMQLVEHVDALLALTNAEVVQHVQCHKASRSTAEEKLITSHISCPVNQSSTSSTREPESSKLSSTRGSSNESAEMKVVGEEANAKTNVMDISNSSILSTSTGNATASQSKEGDCEGEGEGEGNENHAGAAASSGGSIVCTASVKDMVDGSNGSDIQSDLALRKSQQQSMHLAKTSAVPQTANTHVRFADSRDENYSNHQDDRSPNVPVRKLLLLDESEKGDENRESSSNSQSQSDGIESSQEHRCAPMKRSRTFPGSLPEKTKTLKTNAGVSANMYGNDVGADMACNQEGSGGMHTQQDSASRPSSQEIDLMLT